MMYHCPALGDIKQRYKEMEELFTENNLECLRQYYTFDCKMMPPGQPTDRGREGIAVSSIIIARLSGRR